MGASCLSSLLSVATLSRYSLRSCCDGTLLRFPPMKSSKTLGNRAFMFAAPKLWNSLIHDIRTTTSLSCFKMKLKKKIFSQVLFMTRFLILFIWKLRYISIIIIVAVAEVYKNEGNDEYKKSNFNNAIHFYTKGIKVNCKDEELNAKLYSNRAAANLNLGKLVEVSFNCCGVF